MQIIKCWDIQTWDGGDRHNHRYYVATQEAAEAWKETNKYDEIYKKEFVILDDLSEVVEMNDVNKPYLDKEFKELAEKVGLLTPAYHTDDGTRFYIDRMLQMYSLELKKHFGVE